MILYHVTETRLVGKIRRQGLRVLMPSNWVNGKGERLGDGAIHAFECLIDAKRWGAKMDWDLHMETGSGKISIVTLESNRDWDTDHNDTLSQNLSAGRWLKLFESVPPDCIQGIESLTPEHVKEIILR